MRSQNRRRRRERGNNRCCSWVLPEVQDEPQVNVPPLKELWFEMGLRLCEADEIGQLMGDHLLEGWSFAVARLEGMLQVAKDEIWQQMIKNKEMFLVLTNQTQEMAKLTNLAWEAEKEKELQAEKN
ncbi:unnamed protein product [Cuscuta campestris]|uniref:Uncharacterized protein n=1 Tax=Cuscuta campestris TaxID=132261 RepID=A0A484L316_9ASTE|nr:unnamed protein product [Cuscuta campestris]